MFKNDEYKSAEPYGVNTYRKVNINAMNRLSEIW
jgi:hypothetical protein